MSILASIMRFRNALLLSSLKMCVIIEMRDHSIPFLLLRIVFCTSCDDCSPFWGSNKTFSRRN
ncbi:unnamed protein product [Albugo candida]|uniref:Uncharacterized protein n=1 Tax=Albugo candida TaxID=65357 RepID=A0A024G1A8_9STRA|nr:unnamed protein product [Albugo candida]|eukprot:CCI40336.1 unnamed protein product [Albugo candida]